MSPLTGYDYFLQNALKYGWMVPQGGIIMWSGSIATIPAGWFLCNGANGTPDLRDRFIVGAKQDDGGVAKTNVTGALTQTGGALGHVHTFTGDEHTHTFYGDGHEHDMYYYQSATYGDGYNFWQWEYPSTPAYASGTTDEESVEGTTDNTNEVPPYYALAFIMKA